MFGFSIVWAGQFLSYIGSGMTRFALTIWAWQVTGQATALALVGFFSFAPAVLVSPLAGAIVDRVSRKTVMIASDLAAGLSTVVVLILHLTGHLQIWHLYAAGFFASAFESFQFPAYSSAISTMVDKKHYMRANGMLSMAGSASGIVAPILAGGLLVLIGIDGVMLIDIATFSVAVLALAFVSIPRPARSEVGERARGSLLKESVFGLRYIFGNRSLLGIQLAVCSMNLVFGLGFTVLAAMILARSGSDNLVLGTVETLMGVGGVVGGALVTAWGGPKRKVPTLVFGWAGISLLGLAVLGIGQGVVVWSIGAFFSTFFFPITGGASQAIWQAKVPPDIQGKVFAARRTIGQISAPIAMLAAGPLADYVFEPMMRSPTGVAVAFSRVVGSGPGAGMGLMFLALGVVGAVVAFAGYVFPSYRHAEALLPDHDAETTASDAAPEAASAEA
jgi:DHA3 family macrolide efflux protein-like MFS transporter